ncbi:MAG TPA: DUF2721 domain-containing protein [Ignavibacteria bacterium]
MNSDVVLTIQAILAPALGISATGLLLLGLSNRYSSMINRIRLLNAEKRKYMNVIVEKGELPYTENIRLMSIINQIKNLLFRSKLTRNSILCIQTSIILFVLTSVSIGLNVYISSTVFENIALIMFLAGMIFVLIGIIFASLEIQNSYKIAELEVKVD